MKFKVNWIVYFVLLRHRCKIGWAIHKLILKVYFYISVFSIDFGIISAHIQPCSHYVSRNWTQLIFVSCRFSLIHWICSIDEILMYGEILLINAINFDTQTQFMDVALLITRKARQNGSHFEDDKLHRKGNTGHYDGDISDPLPLQRALCTWFTFGNKSYHF